MSRSLDLSANFAGLATTPEPITAHQIDHLLLRIIRQHNTHIKPNIRHEDILLDTKKFLENPNIIWEMIKDFHKSLGNLSIAEKDIQSKYTTIGFQLLKRSEVLHQNKIFVAEPEALTPAIYFYPNDRRNPQEPKLVTEENLKENFCRTNRLSFDEDVYAVPVPQGSYIVPFGYDLRPADQSPSVLGLNIA